MVGDEYLAHQVSLSSFSIGKYEVTQEEWEAVMGTNPSYFKGAKRPVENVSWNACQNFIRTLNRITGLKFRLPTEAEWEYAARGGIKSKGYKYAGGNKLDKIAWHKYNRKNGRNEGLLFNALFDEIGTMPVGLKAPNELGLYDMAGNVMEFCQDYWTKDYISSSQTNPTGPLTGKGRVRRGGCWNLRPADPWDGWDVFLVADRGNNGPEEWDSWTGFRLAL